MALNEYMSVTEFRQYFQEFITVPDANVEFYLSAAEIKVNPKVFINQTKMAHGLWAAHLLSSSPFGMNLKLQTSDGLTDYSKSFQFIQNSVAPGMTVCNII